MKGFWKQYFGMLRKIPDSSLSSLGLDMGLNSAFDSTPDSCDKAVGTCSGDDEYAIEGGGLEPMVITSLCDLDDGVADDS